LNPECWWYDARRDIYRPIAALRQGLADYGAAYLNGKVFVIGGEDSAYKTRTDLGEVGTIH
jgi:N-acetylneuraminic acid mutarotase